MSSENKVWGAQKKREKTPYTGPAFMSQGELDIRARLDALEHGMAAGTDMGGEALSFSRGAYSAEEVREREDLYAQLRAIQEA